MPGSPSKSATALLSLLLGLSGCETVIRGTTQNIRVYSFPSEATCTFTREGKVIGNIRTPSTITVERDRKPIEVLCTKAGFEEARKVLTARQVPQTNALAYIVDRASGAESNYDDSVFTMYLYRRP